MPQLLRCCRIWIRLNARRSNNFLYLIRANQLASADPAKIKAPTLLVYSPTDLVLPEPWIERTAAALREVGTLVDIVP
jgi:homoserine O-acetyltransferase/O-succinyltransferase